MRIFTLFRRMGYVCRWAAPSGALCLMLLLSGCGIARVKEYRTYKAVDSATGDASYFRIRISGYTRLSKLEYDAGWKNAEAVDEVFNDIKSSPGWISDDLKDELRKNMLKMSTAIETKMVALGDKTDPESQREYAALESQLARTIALQERIRVKGSSENLDAPSEKYVIVMSADPDEIMNEIATVVDRQASEGALIKTYRALQEKKRADETKKAAENKAKWELFKTQLSTIPLPQQPGVEEARTALNLYISLLQTFTEATR